MKGLFSAVAAAMVTLLLPVMAVATIAGTNVAEVPDATCVDSAAASTEEWSLPLRGGFIVTSRYGTRYHPVLHRTKLHTGIDLVARSDRTVYAAAARTVRVSAFNAAYGNQVVIDHGGGVSTRYAHMTSPGSVGVGDRVRGETALGTQGSTGYATGPHLHFEVWLNGTDKVDPQPWLAERGIFVG